MVSKKTIAAGEPKVIILDATSAGNGLGRFHVERRRGSSVIRASQEATELLLKIAKWAPNQRLWITIVEGGGIFIKPLGGANGKLA